MSSKKGKTVEFLQANYDAIDSKKPLFKITECKKNKIYLKDLKRYISSNNAKEKEVLNLIMMKAIIEQKADACKYLIQHGYQSDAFNESGDTPVHFAFKHNYDFLREDKGTLLFRSTDDFNHTDNYRLSHLHIACALGNTIAVKKYLKNVTDINAQCSREEDILTYYEYDGYTPLHFAVRHHRYDVVKLLLEHGANIEINDEDQSTPLFIASEVQEYEYPSSWENDLEIIEILIKYGSNVNAKNNNAAMINLFHRFYLLRYDVLRQSEFDVESGIFINKEIEIDYKKRQKEKLELFIKHGMDISLTDQNGNTLLNAILHNLETIRVPNVFEHISFDDTDYLEMVKLILTTNSKIDVSLRNESGESPLSLAVSYMSFDIVKLFLNHTTDLSSIKFDFESETKHYLQTIPTFECARNLIAIVELLLDRGYKLTLEDNLKIMKFLIHGIEECKCYTFVQASGFADAMNFYWPIHIVSCLSRFGYGGTTIEELQDIIINLELIEYAKLYIHEDIKNVVKNLLRKFNIPEPEDYHKYKIKEVEEMKSINLRGDTYLYDVMTKHPHDIYPYIQNILFEETFFEVFEWYTDIIKGHFAKSVTRHYLETSAHNFFLFSSLSSLPYVCCKKILDYLDNKSIYNLCFTIFTDEIDKECFIERKSE